MVGQGEGQAMCLAVQSQQYANLGSLYGHQYPSSELHSSLPVFIHLREVYNMDLDSVNRWCISTQR